MEHWMAGGKRFPQRGDESRKGRKKRKYLPPEQRGKQRGTRKKPAKKKERGK